MNKTSKILLSAFIIIAVVCAFSIVHADIILPGGSRSNDYDEVEETEAPGEVEEVENVVSEQHSELISTLDEEVEEEPHDELIATQDEEAVEARDLIAPAEPEVEEGQFSDTNKMAIAGICAVVLICIVIFCAIRGKGEVPPPVEEVPVGAKPEEQVEEPTQEEAVEEETEKEPEEDDEPKEE